MKLKSLKHKFFILKTYLWIIFSKCNDFHIKLDNFQKLKLKEENNILEKGREREREEMRGIILVD